MRQFLTFPCGGETLSATLDTAHGETGLLVVSGGNEIRIGAHRGMAKLASDVAAEGFPVFRFDRRGIGDSTGENESFTSSADDIAAALQAFRAACPLMKRVIGFGNCDAATALLLHKIPGFAAHVLGNIWVIEAEDDMPPPAAIKARYLERLKDPKACIGLFTGAINLRKLASGLVRIAKPQVPTRLPQQVAAGLEAFGGPVSIVLCTRDTTAIAFADEWSKPGFASARAKPSITLTKLDSASHSFASEADYLALRKALTAHLSA